MCRQNPDDGSSPHPSPLSKVERGNADVTKLPLQNGEGRGEAERGNAVVTVEANVPTELLKNARSLRKNLTEAERLLWQAIRNRKLNNWKFRRQHPIAGFILDFYCAETKISLELDGDYHQSKDQQQYDKSRTELLAEYGIRVFRILNDEVINNMEDVLHKIKSFTNA